ncbi:hypothetical protein OH76DRAFT_1491190 [Lentinus brumalis]|uniref:Integrase core domain-containing protein n=1 Tax=Lentinus brumalis TaxID=2498619 RepID=A0A371CGK6_9APHY|nr:hypothetical protein OH76DRAFT_1491190 [Polyporus brumalis]
MGTENNDIEHKMIDHWGEAHRAFLRGRLLHNVRIEHLWCDMHKDCLEMLIHRL